MKRLPHGSGIVIASIPSALFWLAVINLCFAIVTGERDHCRNSLAGDDPAGTSNTAS